MGFRAHVSIVDIPIGVVPRSRAASRRASAGAESRAEVRVDGHAPGPAVGIPPVGCAEPDWHCNPIP